MSNQVSRPRHKVRRNRDPEEVRMAVERMWKYLNKHCNIYTMEELDEAIKNTKPLNIGFMVNPPNGGW